MSAQSPLAHLSVLSKIKKAPVDISVTAHVDTSADGESYIDFPLPTIIQDEELESGWYQIKGLLNSYEVPDGYHGIIKIKEINPCPNRQCSEEK